MHKRFSPILILAGSMLACGGSDSKGPGTVTPPGTGGTGGETATGGSGGAAGTGLGTGGASGSGGAASGGSGGSSGSGGSVEADASTAGSGGSGGSGGEGADASPPPSSGPMIGWYEAEAVPPNQVFGPASVGNCGAPACPAMAEIKEGLECCSGKKKISQLIRGKGQLQFNNVSAPADGMYDVTWWFHCGKNDNFGDPGCGGDPSRTKSGCRPHILVVNGQQLPKVFEFPCFPGTWGQIHAATTPVPLKAGAMNTIKVYATPGRDASDMDAIAVYPAGQGIKPVAFAH
jgi:hypothetical protein